MNLADELKDPDSILNFYKRVLALLHNEPALAEGDYVALNESDPNILLYLRRYKDGAAIVVLNMSGKKQIASFDLGRQGFSNLSAETLVTTFKAHPQPVSLSSVSLELFSLYIGKIRK